MTGKYAHDFNLTTLDSTRRILPWGNRNLEDVFCTFYSYLSWTKLLGAVLGVGHGRGFGFLGVGCVVKHHTLRMTLPGSSRLRMSGVERTGPGCTYGALSLALRSSSTS